MSVITRNNAVPAALPMKEEYYLCDSCINTFIFSLEYCGGNKRNTEGFGHLWPLYAQSLLTAPVVQFSSI